MSAKVFTFENQTNLNKCRVVCYCSGKSDKFIIIFKIPALPCRMPDCLSWMEQPLFNQEINILCLNPGHKINVHCYHSTHLQK